MISNAIYYLLKNNASIAALVSTRIYPGAVMQTDTHPSVYFSVTGATEDKTKSGPTDIHFIDISITVIANKYSDAESLSDLIRVLLDGYEGTVDGVVIELISYQGRSDSNVDATLIQQITQNFQIITQQ